MKPRRVSKIQYTLSDHAQLRCSQRNYRNEDLDLVMAFGTATTEGFLMGDKDVRMLLEI